MESYTIIEMDTTELYLKIWKGEPDIFLSEEKAGYK